MRARTEACAAVFPELARSGRSRLAEIRALHLARLVDLEHVALLDVVEALEMDPALEAFLDLAHVVLDPPQRVDRRVVDDRPLAKHPNPCVAADDAARH